MLQQAAEAEAAVLCSLAPARATCLPLQAAGAAPDILAAVVLGLPGRRAAMVLECPAPPVGRAA